MNIRPAHIISLLFVLAIVVSAIRPEISSVVNQTTIMAFLFLITYKLYKNE